jgi:LysM repeat protein
MDVLKEVPHMREQMRHPIDCVRGLIGRLHQAVARRPRRWGTALALLVVGTVAVVAALPRITSASETSVLANGSFEQGFVHIPGCGIVGAGWGCFTNGGAANYGFYDDEWELTVADGHHSQLVEINTNNLAAGDADRYAGIYQTARVVKGAKYTLSLRGMIRTSNTEGDPWRYRVQVGYLNWPQGDWRDVENWTDVGWNDYFKRTEPGGFSAFQTSFVPDADAITLFIRVWKKWGVAYEELDVNLDEIALVGPAPDRGVRGHGKEQEMGPRDGPMAGGTGGPVGSPGMDGGYAGEVGWPGTPDNGPLICNGPDLVYNGSFEQGFADTPLGMVGRGWGAFTNGGAANFGFYDEEWEPVVADGHHGQLIEINTRSVYPADANRYAGIYQRIEGLHKGATYELTLRGLLRGEGSEDDPYRFAAQWGVGTSPDWSRLESDEWEEMNLGPIYDRTEPGAMAVYSARFKAPSDSAVLFIRGWKKWGITNDEMDFNVDAIRVQACQPDGKGWGSGGPAGGMNPDGWRAGGMGDGGAACLYVVKPGDSLGAIALQFGVDVDTLMRANGVENADLIYVGQKFEIPGCGKGGPVGDRPVDGPQRPPVDERPTDRPGKGEPEIDRGPEVMYTVQSGDMLGAIAAAYGLDVYELARYNGIDNLNVIYVGQVLRIPSHAN